jgi:hypothetical protein
MFWAKHEQNIHNPKKSKKLCGIIFKFGISDIFGTWVAVQDDRKKWRGKLTYAFGALK